MPTGSLAPLPQYMQELIDSTNELIIQFSEEYEALADAVHNLNDHVENHQRYAVPHPDVWLPLTSDIHLKEGFGCTEFSRASKATYINKSGQLCIAEEHEPRFEREGILIEGASTNYLIHSEDIDKTNRHRYNTTFTPASGFPLGGTRFSRTEKDKTAYVRFTVAGQEGVVTSSIFIKPDYGTHVWLGVVRRDGSAYIHGSRLVNLETGDDSFKTKLLADGLYRVWVTYDAGEGESGNSSGLEVTIRDGGGVDGTSIFVGGWQLDTLPFASSYIPTEDAPVTRPKERLLIEPENNLLKWGYTQSMTINLINNRAGMSSGYYELMSQASTSPGYLQRNLHRIFDGRYQHYSNSSNLSAYVGVNETSVMVTRYINGLDKDSLENHSMFNNGELTGQRNGALQRNGEYNPVYGFLAAQASTSGAAFHVRDFRVWHQVLTDEQIKSVA